MKKNKLFQSALSLMLVGGMLTACGSSASSTAASTAASTGSDSTAASTASDSAAPAATKQYVIGIAEAQANDEVTTRRAYLEDFIAPTYNVKFIFSETLKDDAATKTFIENCIDSGADAIIDMKSASGQMAQLCMDNGLVYTINGNYTQHPELLTTDYTNFAGCIGANNAQVGSLFGGWLEENASEDGSEGFLISTSLAAQGKAVLDLCTAAVFAVTLGVAVAVIALPMLAVMLALFFAAEAIAPFVTPEMLQDFISCGGVLTIVAGMRVSGIKQYPIANMIPALLLVLPASAIWQTLMV